MEKYVPRHRWEQRPDDALSGHKITWVEIDDAEGDDVIATLATITAAHGRTVTCLSGDRDLHQLAAPTITILTPERRQITPATLVARYRVTPAQWPDYRALTGDPADNIAGIRGIGPHIAATLLAGRLHLEDLPGSGRLYGVRGAAVTQAWPQLLVWRDLIRLKLLRLQPLAHTLHATRPTRSGRDLAGRRIEPGRIAHRLARYRRRFG
jgi:5'-3' exonuclease-like protein